MITITIPAQPAREYWDPAREEFIYKEATPEYKLSLEHSLVSISKWESKWKKAFLKKEEKTPEQVLDYVKCMVLGNEEIPDSVFENISKEDVKRITDYIEDTMTATHINQRPDNGNKPKSKDVVTSELIYYWMIANEIPFECQYWHLNRLMALIQVCSVKNAAMYGGKKGKGSKADLLRNNAAMNMARRAKSGSLG